MSATSGAPVTSTSSIDGLRSSVDRKRAPLDDGSVSAQALRLHALGSLVATLSDRDGLLGRADADRLAADCGALADELVDAGLWHENDVSYVIVALVPPPSPVSRSCDP